MYKLEVFENGEWKFGAETYSVYDALGIFRAWIWAGIECRVVSPDTRTLKRAIESHT